MNAEDPSTEDFSRDDDSSRDAAEAAQAHAAAEAAVDAWRREGVPPDWDALPPAVRTRIADLLLLEGLTPRALRGESPRDREGVDRALARIRREAFGPDPAALEAPAATTATPALPFLSSVQPTEPPSGMDDDFHPVLFASDSNDDECKARVPVEPPRDLRMEDLAPRFAAAEEASNERRSQRGTPLRWMLRGVLFAAAAAYLAVNFQRPGETTAMAAMAKASAAAEALVDREYLVRAELVDAGPRKHWEARLYVRGGRKFAVRFPGVAGEVWAGTDGGQAWIVPALPILPVRISPNPIWLDAWLDDGRVDGVRPCLEISALLERLAKHYDLVRLPDGPAPGLPGVDRLRIEAKRRDDGDPKAPSGVRVWIDADSGVVERMEVDWAADAPVSVRSASFELKAARPLPSDWFDHAAHHEPRRPILMFP